jgi:hypothetical protein
MNDISWAGSGSRTCHVAVCPLLPGMLTLVTRGGCLAGRTEHGHSAAVHLPQVWGQCATGPQICSIKRILHHCTHHPLYTAPALALSSRVSTCECELASPHGTGPGNVPSEDQGDQGRQGGAASRLR